MAMFVGRVSFFIIEYFCILESIRLSLWRYSNISSQEGLFRCDVHISYSSVRLRFCFTEGCIFIVILRHAFVGYSSDFRALGCVHLRYFI